MKKSISIIMLGVAVAAIAHMSSITWKSTNLNLGEVRTGEVKELAFEFTNDGTNPIQILQAKGSCGCTVIDYPSEEIAPGESAKILANFKASKLGQFRKSVKVKTTASEEYEQLYFTGEVVE